MQETPDRTLLVDPAGLGVGWIAQMAPFQRSAKVWLALWPTAVQDVGAVQDTPDRLAPTAVIGVVWIDQVSVVLSHRSTSGMLVPCPTAVQSVAVGHDTPAPAPEVVCSDQVVPFHRSASVTEPACPTAVQAVAAVHDTPYSALKE